MMQETLLQPSLIQPLSLEHVKDTLRIHSDIEDSRLQSLIQAATNWIENLTSKALLEQTRFMTTRITQEKLSRLAQQSHRLHIDLPTRPLIAVEAVTLDGLPWTQYKVSENHRVIFTRPPTPGDVTIIYRAGYGPDRDSVPPILRQAILMAVVRFYEDMTFPQESEMRSIIGPYRYSTLH